MPSRNPQPRPSSALLVTAALAPTLIFLATLIAAALAAEATGILLGGTAAALVVWYVTNRALLRARHGKGGSPGTATAAVAARSETRGAPVRCRQDRAAVEVPEVDVR